MPKKNAPFTKRARKKAPAKSFGQRLIDILDYSIAHPQTMTVVARRVDVGQVRKNIHFTQRAFSDTFRIQLETLKQWEQGKRVPDATARAYLTCIAKAPDVIANLLRS